MIVDAQSLNNGRLTAIMDDGNEHEIGVDFFRASYPVDPTIAHKIVQEYAKQKGIAPTEFLVRSRLPKTNVKPRKTNDSEATSLQLVKSDKAEQPKEESKHDNLTAMAQALQDAHNKRKDDVKPEEQKASADKPEGAIVKRSQGEKKRAYQKKDKERSARSRAAYERYVKEIAQKIEESPTAMQAAVPGPGVTTEQVSDAELQFALKLVKLLKGVM
jgi:ubiquitin